MNSYKRVLVMLFFAMAVVAFKFWSVDAWAQSSYYTSQGCSGCHTTTSTCNGCHAHGAHPSSAKNSINISGATDKSSYAPGETVSVTINGGYRTGWVRAVLLDQNQVELARSSGNSSGMGSSTTFPAVLTAPAPTAAGTYTWKVAWYGNQYDATGAAFGTQWVPDANNSNHGMEIFNANSFTVAPSTDTTIPVVSTFTLPATATSLTVSVSSFTATDNIGVTGYLVTSSAATPAATNSGWSASAPASVTAATAGSITFYGWAKDAAGNVSLAKSATVVITLPVPPPVISGTPAQTDTVGTIYNFTPTASDPSGLPLTFAIASQPAWATFSTITGTLSGTPSAAGTFSNISISVSNGTTTATLPQFSIVVADSGSGSSGGSGGSGGSGTPVPVMEGMWMLPGLLAGVGLFIRNRKG